MTRRDELIQKVSGINKERDFAILELMAYHPEYSQQQILENLNLDFTQANLSIILRNNRILYNTLILELNPLACKEGRLQELIELYRKKKDKGTRKDIVDLLDQIRNELKEEKSLIDQSQSYSFTVKIIKNDGENERDRNIPAYETDRSI